MFNQILTYIVFDSKLSYKVNSVKSDHILSLISIFLILIFFITEERIFIPMLLCLKIKCVSEVIVSNDFVKPSTDLTVMLFEERLRNSRFGILKHEIGDSKYSAI